MLTTPESIRTLQRKLYRKAKQEPAGRFHALYDKVYRADILSHAYNLVRLVQSADDSRLDEGACLEVKNIGKPCAGKPHARFDEGGQAQRLLSTLPPLFTAFNGYFDQVCYHPLFCFTGNGDLLGARLRPGNVHSADGVLGLISPLVDRYRSWFNQFWLRGDAAFAGPDLYEFCEKKRITYFIRLSSNSSLKKLIEPHLQRPAGRPPKSGVQVRVVELRYQAEKWNKPRRVVCKIEWHVGELFPRVGFIVTNSNIEAHKVLTIYNGRAEIENRIKRGRTPSDGTSGILGRERQAIHRLDHQAACKGWSEGRLPCPKMVCACSNGFFTRPVLSDSIRLNP